MKQMRDGVVFNYNNEDEFKEYLRWQKENDVWEEVTISKLKAIPITNAFLTDADKENLELTVEDNIVAETIKQTGILVRFPFMTEVTRTECLRYTAFADIFNRTTAYGPVYRMMTAEERCNDLNQKFKYIKKKAKILMRDDVIHAMKSSDYKVFPAYDLVEIMTKEIGEYSFTSGIIDNEHTQMSLTLDGITAAEIKETFQEIANKAGELIVDVTPSITFITGDVGMSAVHILPVLESSDGQRMVIGEASLKHTTNHSLKDWKDMCRGIFNLFIDSMKEIDALMNVEIDFPCECFEHVVKFLCKTYSGMPKKSADSLIEEYKISYNGQMVTAFDLYWFLWRLDAKEDKSFVQTLALQDVLRKAAVIDWRAYDYIV